MCPRRANECFVPGGTLAAGSNEVLHKPAFAGVSRIAAALGKPRARGRADPRPRGTGSGPRAHFFLATPAPASAEPAPRIALKKSLPVSTTITSDFLLKLAR